MVTPARKPSFVPLKNNNIRKLSLTTNIMKIIGVSSPASAYTTTYLVEVSDAELAKMAGYGYRTEREFNDRCKIGAEIPVAKLYDHLVTLEAKGKELASSAAMLRSAATLLESLPAPFVPEPPAPAPEPPKAPF